VDEDVDCGAREARASRVSAVDIARMVRARGGAVRARGGRLRRAVM